MQTKIEVTKTYWVGISSDQLKDLSSVVVKSLHNDANPKDKMAIEPDELEALNALRQALLNV